MRIRSFAISLIVGGIALFASAPAFAVVCNPSNTTEVSCLKAADKSCSQLGTSTMDKDQKNIIACLRTDAGALEWKAMTSGGSGGGACYVAAYPTWGRPNIYVMQKISGFTEGETLASIFTATTTHPNNNVDDVHTLSCNAGYTMSWCNGNLIDGGCTVTQTADETYSLRLYLSCCKKP